MQDFIQCQQGYPVALLARAALCQLGKWGGNLSWSFSSFVCIYIFKSAKGGI